MGECIKRKSDLIKQLKVSSDSITNFLGQKADGGIEIVSLYSSKRELSEVHVSKQSILQYLTGADLKYFKRMGSCIGASALHEFSQYLELKDPFNNNDSYKKADCISLADQSGAGTGVYSIATFYAKPSDLLAGACALRKGGWRNDAEAFQRLIEVGRIAKMREFLADGGESFPTNLVVAMTGASIGEESGNTFVSIPQKRDSISIIDGQHRLFSYGDIADAFNEKIRSLADEHRLLVTAVVFDKGVSESNKLSKQAQLFLDINSKQKKIPAALTQAINKMRNPQSSDGFASNFIEELLKGGFFEVGTSLVSTASIVTYSLVPLINSDLKKGTSLVSKFKVLAKNKNSDVDLVKYNEFTRELLLKYLESWKSMVKRSGQFIANEAESKVFTGAAIGGVFYSLKYYLEGNEFSDLEAMLTWAESAFESIEFDYSAEGFDYASNGRNKVGRDLRAKLDDQDL